MSDADSFFRALKRQFWIFVIGQFALVIFLAVGFYYRTENFRTNQVEFNVDQKATNMRIEQELKAKVSIEMSVEMQKQYNERAVRMESKLDRLFKPAI
ncbi:MAG: hypothetical protein WCO63_01385 [Bacteroidota bacterium]